MIFVSNCPALPTNGSPCSSSSAPGASPTNIILASGLPTPNTTVFRELARCGHLRQASAFSRRAAKAALRASGGRPGCGIVAGEPASARDGSGPDSGRGATSDRGAGAGAAGGGGFGFVGAGAWARAWAGAVDWVLSMRQVLGL